MTFSGFNDGGEALYDTKDAAIERAKMMHAWDGNTNGKIMVQKNIPLWFDHLIKGTWFERLAYYELKND